jgi:rod shape-determining protein MreC
MAVQSSFLFPIADSLFPVSMDSFFNRFKNPLALIAIVLIQVIVLAVQLPATSQEYGTTVQTDGPTVTLLRRWTAGLITPMEELLHGSGTRVRGFWTNYIDLRHARERDQQLQQEVARLRQEQAAFVEDAAQGRRLQQLLAFKEQYIASTVAAQVIGTSGSERSHVIYIDKGSDDGLKPEQAVITPDGVVGKLRDVFPHTAQVLLISDPTSGAGVILQSTRIRGILRGTDTGQVQINNLTADSRIQPGETVVTSGGDMVFPRGIPVGTIESIAPDPLHQPYTAITIRPAASLSRLEEVLVITGTQNTLPGSAQQDVSIAQATADDQKRAADLVAEKLPSLHDPNAPATTDAKPGAPADGSAPPAVDPNVAPPRPRPVLHPDHYSPGAVPPADELTPGGHNPVMAVPPRPADHPTEDSTEPPPQGSPPPL